VKRSDEPEPRVPDYPSILAQLIGELASRELSLKIGRSSRFTFQETETGSRFAIPAEYELCAHLATNLPETRGSLLLKHCDVDLLVKEALERQTLSAEAENDSDEDAASRLFHELFARPVVLLGFLNDRLLTLQGVTLQKVDTQPKRRAHEIAFQLQKFTPFNADLSIHLLQPMEAILLLPEKLLTTAAVRLADPDAVQATEEIFLENAPRLNRELSNWLEAKAEEQTGESEDRAEEEHEQTEEETVELEDPAFAEWLEEQEEAWAQDRTDSADSAGSAEDEFLEEVLLGEEPSIEDLSAPSWTDSDEEEPPGEQPPAPPEIDPGIDALDDLLASLLEELPQETDELVLKSPQDLLFAQLFFPGQLALHSQAQLGARIEVRPVEMASLPLARLREEPAGLMARTLYEGPFSGNTAFVFPQDGLVELARHTRQRPADLVQFLLQPGMAEMRAVNPDLQFQVQPIRSIDFSRLQTENQQLSIRISYRMEVEGCAPLEFVQYAPTIFVNRLMEILTGCEGIQFLRPNARNMMLSFLDLNALLAASVLEDPDRAKAWIGPLLGPQFVPLFRPGETLPDLFDFETLLELSDLQLRRVLENVSMGRLKSRELACALAYMSPELRRRILRTMPWGDVEKVLNGRLRIRLKEMWDTRRKFAHLLYHAVLQTLDEPPFQLHRQARWFLDELGTDWRVRAEAVLQDTVFIVAGIMDFDSLVDLQDRYLQRVLAKPYLLKKGARVLASAISPVKSPMRGKVFRNLPDKRLEEVAALVRESKFSPEEVKHDQMLIAQLVYYADLSGEIDTPEPVHRQVEQYLQAIGENLRYRAHGIMQDGTFAALVAQLSPGSLRDLQGLVKREDFLWALQDCDEETLACFTRGIGGKGREQLLADIRYARRRVADEDEGVYRSAAARLRIIDAIRLVSRFRDEQDGG